MDKVMKKLLAIGEKEYIKSLEPGSKIKFKVKPYSKEYEGVVSCVSDNLEIQIKNSNAPGGNWDIDLIVPVELEGFIYAR